MKAKKNLLLYILVSVLAVAITSGFFLAMMPVKVVEHRVNCGLPEVVVKEVPKVEIKEVPKVEVKEIDYLGMAVDEFKKKLDDFNICGGDEYDVEDISIKQIYAFY